jgi:SAM-dependent methyltransferase
VSDSGGAWQIGGAEGGWWAVERAKFIGERLAPLLPTAGVAVDLGCGRGEVVDLLAGRVRTVVGVDFEVFPQWTSRAGVAYVVADANHLPFRPGRAGLVTCLDVIEHFADDAVPLGAARRLVRPDGHVLVTVPAGPGLWSPFDDRVGHHRRYTSATLDAATERAGLRPGEPSAYYFSWLFPAAWALRRRDRPEADDAGDGLLGRLVAGVAAALSWAERRLLRKVRAPMGTSLFTLCRPVPDPGTPATST